MVGWGPAAVASRVLPLRWFAGEQLWWLEGCCRCDGWLGNSCGGWKGPGGWKACNELGCRDRRGAAAAGVVPTASLVSAQCLLQD